MSTDSKNIYLALAAIMRDCEPIAKAEKNEGQGFFFRGIQTVMNELHPVFTAHGVVCVPSVKHAEHRDAGLTKNNVVQTRAIVTCGFIFLASDGSSFEAVTIGEGLDSADKATGKAMSMALKYALTQTFLIPTQEVVDADYYDPTVDARSQLALQNRDRPKVQKIIDQHIADATALIAEAGAEREQAKKETNKEKKSSMEEIARGKEARAKELQGLASELRCKLHDLDVSQGYAQPAPEPEKTTVKGTQVESVPIPTHTAPAATTAPAQTPAPATATKAAPQEKPVTAPTATTTPEPPANDDWRDVICHIGKSPGTVHGKRIGDIISEKSSKEHVESIVKWFFDKLGENPALEKDRSLLLAVRSAYLAWKSANGAPATAPAPDAPAKEAPPAASTAQPTNWREHRIVSKTDKTINGIALGDMTLKELQALNARMDKIDKTRATPYQKTLCALLALGIAELSAPTGDHTERLKAALESSKIEIENFLGIGRSAGWFPKETETLNSITPEEVETMFTDWKVIEENCDQIPA